MEPFSETTPSFTPKAPQNTINSLPQQKVTPALISYAEKLSQISSLSGWLLFLKNHTPKYLKSGEFILFYESQQFGLRRAYIKNKRFHEEVAQTPWSIPPSTSFNSPEINLYLAGEMGRSFSRVLAVPFHEKTSFPGRNRSPVLFVEMRPEKNQKALDFFQEKEDILKLTLKRILLNTYRSRASHLWNYVFEGWGEALAIIKGEQLIRANSHFKKLLSLYPHLLNFIKTKTLFQENGRSYQFHYCPIPSEQEETTGLTHTSSDDLISSSENKHQFKESYNPSSEKDRKEMGLIYCQDLTGYFQLKESLLQSEKMAAIGKLGQNIAHELNNPLTGLRAMSQILTQNKDLKRFSEDFQAVEAAATRSQKIIESLLTFSRAQKTENQICHINTIVRETLPLLKTLSNGIEIKLSLDDKNPLTIYENPSLLQQMIFNLMTNACHAVHHLKGWQKPRIEVKTTLHSTKMLSLEIKDNGCGIPSNHLEKIFQPLWTTKKPGEGTGLGLGIVRRFVRSGGGDILVSSEFNKGATFTVFLPLRTQIYISPV